MPAQNHHSDVRNQRHGNRRRRLVALMTVWFVMLLVMPMPSLAAPAQQEGAEEGPAPNSMRIQPRELEDVDQGAQGNDSDQPSGMAPRRLIIDTDPGVDDAVAIVALLSQGRYQVEVLGIATVAGNADALSGANNALNILKSLGRTDIPVAIGSHAPMVRAPSSTGKLLHGPDGLWFLGLQNPNDLSGLVQDAVGGFYCARPSWEGATLIALGPLTNVARAVKTCSGVMDTISEIVVLGGAKYGGNITPVAEYNTWQDPEALDFVLDYVEQAKLENRPHPELTLVPLDAFSQLTITSKDVEKLARKANPAMAFVVPALQQYVFVQEQNGGTAGIPDAVAVAMALDPARYGQSQTALIRVMLPDPSFDQQPGGLSLARGITVVGLTFAERIPMLATDTELSYIANQVFMDPNFDLQGALFGILVRGPDNAQFVTDINESRLAKDLFKALTK